MITLENYVLEQEINDVTFIDAYAEQAIAEMNVISSLLDCYCKQELITEYTSTDASEFGVFQEGEKWDKFKAGASEKWSNFKSFLKKAAEAFIVAVQTVIAKLTKVPTNTIKASIDTLRNTMGTDQNITISGVNPNFHKDFELLMEASRQIVNELFDLKLSTDNGSKVTSAKFQSILATVEKVEKEFNISASDTVARSKERRKKDAGSTTMTIDDIDAYINETLGLIEKENYIGQLKDLIKEYKKLIKADAKEVRNADKDLYKDIKESENGIYNPKNMKKVVDVMSLISKELTILASDYSKSINSILTKANKDYKKSGKTGTPKSDSASVGTMPKRQWNMSANMDDESIDSEKLHDTAGKSLTNTQFKETGGRTTKTDVFNYKKDSGLSTYEHATSEIGENSVISEFDV